MSELIKIVQKTFEQIKIEDETWFEFWSARDLMKALGYSQWRRFDGVIEKAKIACKNSWSDVWKHFLPEVAKTSKVWWRPRENYFLTRYACYLIAQNWDSRKVEISLAQTYFASQTRKIELAEAEIENEKRLEARKKFAKSEREIEETIYKRWIKLPVEFATFKNKWIQALYWLSVKALKARKNIPEKRALADFDTEVELKAKDFIYAMTDHNIKKKNLEWKSKLEWELVDNSKATRKTLIERWISPENLEAQEDLKKVEKKLKLRNWNKNLTKKS